ncbi:MAG: acyl-ACP--UDP-N-acetylglucosamine O-acyltransferase [Myxococcota bacterium]
MAIHETAVVHADARLGEGVEVGPYSVVGAGVQLGDGVVVGPHCVIEGETQIGAGTRLHAHACVGGPPQDRGHDGSVTRTEVGEGCVFREFVTVHAGSSQGAGTTRVGAGTWLMSGAHVAHDCQVGAGVTVASGATLAAAVTVGDQATIGSLAGLHPHVRIGRLALVGAGALCAQDVPPFTLAQGDRARLFGLNITALRQQPMNPDVVRALKHAWRKVFTSGLALRTGVRHAREEAGDCAEILELLDFLDASQRGVCRAASVG